MLYYFDSSAAVKRYAPESGSKWVDSIFDFPDSRIYLAQVGIVEVAAALVRKVRTAELERNDYEAALWLFMADVRAEEYIVIPINDPDIKLAVELTRRHPLRGYDAVHLALAIGLNAAVIEAGLSPLAFVSADDVLCQAAQSEGLSADNPNNH